ncbi:MAG: hypothetical protein IJA55_01410 [Clostridia bacterium]|nr:hypothetical protein [Clostridia bacterium]
MKSFIISIVVLTLCISIAFLNYAITLDRVGVLLGQAEAITKANAPVFSQKWEKTREILRYTSRRNLLRDIDNAVELLEKCDDADFDSAKTALIYKMKELCDSQGFGIKTIL